MEYPPEWVAHGTVFGGHEQQKYAPACICLQILLQNPLQGHVLIDHAQFEDGSVSVEACLMNMLDRMQTGRFKVLAHLHDWLEEFRLYHRKDGKVVKEGDDLMAATRYALMMLRYARTETARRKFNAPLDYAPLHIV